MWGVLKLALGILAFAFFMNANPASFVARGSLTPTAEAIVGRPATPVSVAGVARRTTRRCVARVYPC
jgi:hypothetical protein